MSSTDWKIDTSSPVLVTGATGYIAGVLIKQLLDAGVTVHGTVRDPSNTERLQYLVDVADKSSGSLKFFHGDLLEDGSFAEGMKGCSVVFHTASPVVFEAKDPQKELVDPAVNGTKNVLSTATKTPSVRRVVLTSSVATMCTDASEKDNAPNGILTEDIINMTASLDYQPYHFGKTLAEMAAWRLAGSQNQWTLATIHPSFVLGPGVKYHASSESFKFMVSMCGGEYASGAPNIGLGFVSVDDVAKAHIVAAYKEDVVGRHILSAANTSFMEVAETLRKKYPQYPIPTKAVPKAMLYLIGPLIHSAIKRRFVMKNVDVKTNYDNTKSKEALGIEYRPMDETLYEMLEQVIENGGLEKK